MEHDLELIIPRLEIFATWIFLIFPYPGNTGNRVFLIFSYPGNIENWILTGLAANIVVRTANTR